MKHKLTRNIGLKLLSVLVAFLIWILVVNIDDPMDSRLFRDIETKIVNEDSVTEIDRVFETLSGSTVVLKVSERRSVLDELSREDFTVTADMENLNEMNTVPLTVTCSNPAVTWDEIEIVPTSMKVKLEQKKQEEFLITINSSGKPKDGYEVGKTEILQGKTVQIAGAESTLNRIGQVTASINVSGIGTDQRLEAPLSVYDKNGDPVQLDRLQITDSNGVLLDDNSVIVDVTLWEVMSGIPVGVETLGTPAEGYRISEIKTVPVTVDLVGTPEALAELNGKITIQDAVSVEGATESFTEDLDLTETLSEVENIRLAENVDSTISVTVQVEKTGDQTVEVPLSNLEVQNRPEKMTLTFSPADELSISVHAEDGMVALQLSDIRASVDLSVCAEPGDYEIPVTIQLPDGYTLAADVTLMVNAREQQVEDAAEPEKDTEE